MGSLLRQLALLCAEHPLREKIVVVPSLAIGHQIGDALARGGTPWINLRFETTRTIADAVAGLTLAREGKSMLSRAQALALVERACDRVLDESSYFAALRGSPGLHRAIQRSIDDLRLAGVAGPLPSAVFEEPRKAQDLARIVEAYEQELEARRLVDRCGVVTRAIELLEGGAPGPWGDAVWLASEAVELPHEESRLVALASRGAVKARIAGTRDDGASMPALEHVELLAATGEENEVRAVFRTIVREGGRFDDAELVYAVADPYLPLLFELSAEYGVETTFAEGVAVSFTLPGQAVLAFLRWCGDGWNAVDLDLAARAGALKTGEESLPPSALSRILRAAAIGWGRDRYRTRLASLAAERESALAEADLTEAQTESRTRDWQQAQAALRFIDRLLAITEELVPQDGDRIRAGALASAARAFVDGFARVGNERDAMALAALRRTFDELAQLPDGTIELSEAAARLREAVLLLFTNASNTRPGHLHVAPLRSAAWSGRSRLFIVGMGEAQFPGAGLQDPIVLDAEREGLNRAIEPRQIALLGEAPLRASERLRRCLGRAPSARWTISYSALSLREQREAFPANDLREIASGRPMSKSGFIDAEAPLGATDWWLVQRFVARREDYAQALRQEYSWLRRGDEASEARSGTDLTRWDGVVDVEQAAVDPRLSGRLLSASQIERMASCPYGWFLRHLLRIEPPDDLVRDPDRWLDARNLGVLLHELFESTMTRLCAARARPDLGLHLPMMTILAEEVLAKWRELIPPPNGGAFQRQRDEVLRTCETFLRLEQRACADAEAMYFEVPFGFSEAADHPLGMVEPLQVDLGGDRKVRLRGRIDRVDRTVRGTWQVWDYKTGGLYGWEGGWTFAGGRKVQHAIYARALAEMLKKKGIDASPVVESSGYSFPTPKGGGERVRKSTEPGRLEEVLNRTFDVVASGFFAHPEDEGDCRFCDFTTICGGAREAARRAAAKYAANGDSPLVQRWRRLNAVD